MPRALMPASREQGEKLAAAAADVEDLRRAGEDVDVHGQAFADRLRRAAELVLEAHILVPEGILRHGRPVSGAPSLSSSVGRDRCGSGRDALQVAPQQLRRLLKDPDRHAELVVGGVHRAHARLDAALARRQRLAVAHGLVDQLLEALRRAGIDVLDDRRVEGFLRTQRGREHAADPEKEAMRERAAGRLRAGHPPEHVQALDVSKVRRLRSRCLRHARIDQRPTSPSTGLLAVAYIFRGIRPER